MIRIILANMPLELYEQQNVAEISPGYRLCLGARYSLGAGKVRPPFHFDHHSPAYRGAYRAPCNDESIPVLGSEEAVIIAGMNPDTFVGLCRMMGRDLPCVDLSFMEEMDLRGKSICRNPSDSTLLYMLGVERLASLIGFPALDYFPIDVTDAVRKMMQKGTREVIELGRKALEESGVREPNWRIGNVAFWHIRPGEPSSVARTYKDGADIAVTYLQGFRQVVISSNPKTDYDFSGAEIAGIRFGGSAHSAGSPRKQCCGLRDAERVAEEIAERIRKDGTSYIVKPTPRRRSAGED